MANTLQFVLKKAIHFTLAKFYGKVGDILVCTPPKATVYRSGSLKVSFDLPKTSIDALNRNGFLGPVGDAPVAEPEAPVVQEPVVQEPVEPPPAPPAPEVTEPVPPAEPVVQEPAPSEGADEPPSEDRIPQDTPVEGAKTPEQLAAEAAAAILATELPQDDGDIEDAADEAPGPVDAAADATPKPVKSSRRAKAAAATAN